MHGTNYEVQQTSTIPWYEINNINAFDSPCVVLYEDRLLQNIKKAVSRVSHPSLLRPHVKTNKIPEVCRHMMENGITKFKCATIAEAEMLASISAPDIMLAYQPVGPKALRYLKLVQTYPASSFSCIVDSLPVCKILSDYFLNEGLQTKVFIDMNTGMNRTGLRAEALYKFIDAVSGFSGLIIAGIHAYDGHVKEKDIDLRQQMSDASFAEVEKVSDYLQQKLGRKMTIVAGGSPSFITHTHRDVECSPGTFVFWDWGYKMLCPDEPYEFAALVITRVISIVDEHTISTDLGYKAIAAEGPMPRMYMLNAPGAQQTMHSEEHLTLHVEDASKFSLGDVLYAVPVHICPTIALYDEVYVAEENRITKSWKVTARARKLTI